MTRSLVDKNSQRVNVILMAMSLLALIGLGLSIHLTYLHYNIHTNPDFHTSCAVSETVNCETVALSSYSVVAGLPVSVWGIAGYVIIFAVLLVALLFRRKTGWPLLFVLLTLCFVAAGISLELGIISYTRIDAFCLYCTASYLVNLILLVLSVAVVFFARRPLKMLVATDLMFLIGKPVVTVVLVILGLAIPTLARLSVEPYWHQDRWSDVVVINHGENEQGHWIGADRPMATIYEYTDYECPYCRAAHHRLRKILAEVGDKVRLIHRHFPLDQKCNPTVNRPFHRYACDFSVAAECAGEQGKYWEMNDAIFSAQDTQQAARVDVTKLALTMGLDRGDFSACLKSKAPLARIGRQIEEGVAAGVHATPTFMINGQPFVGRLTRAQIEKFLK